MTPPHVPLSKLSRELYIRFLNRARALGFAFVRFDEFLDGPPAHPRYIALRHDIDFAPSYSLQMAELEQAAGVTSTYFVLVDGQFYNPVDRTVVEQLRRIRALDHEIGLHFAAASASGADLGEEIAFRLDLLSRIVDAQVQSVSQHDPVNAGFATVRLPAGRVVVDAYQVVRDHDLLYVSESAMMWREHTFESALEQGRNLCLLAHPHSWLAPQDDYIALIRELEAEEVRGVTARFGAFVDGLDDYYRRRLEEGA